MQLGGRGGGKLFWGEELPPGPIIIKHIFNRGLLTLDESYIFGGCKIFIQSHYSLLLGAMLLPEIENFHFDSLHDGPFTQLPYN
jgi:hypothetical protein